MPRSNSLRRLSIALGFGKPIEKMLAGLGEEKSEKVEENAAEAEVPELPKAEPEATAATTEPVVEVQVKEEEAAAAAPIPGTGALSQFLTLSKEKYLNDFKANPPRGGQWTVAMGNEAGDLDSLACAIAFAFYNATSSNTPTIPLYQVYSGDFKLRPENLYALSLAGITADAAPETLVTLSDLPSPISPNTFPSINFALVDHNRLGSSFSSAPETANVTAVIDHHVDENLYKDASPRLVASSGSCASHVATLFFPPATQLPPELATLLLTAILIDTDGLKIGGKAELDDVKAVLFLISRSTLTFSAVGNELLENAEGILAKATAAATAVPQASAPEAEGATADAPATTATTEEKEKKDDDGWVKVQEALSEVAPVKLLAEELASKKADVGDLSIRDLLRRDYKEYTLETPYIVEPNKKGKKKEKVAEKVAEKPEAEKGKEKEKEGEGEAGAATATTETPAAPATPAAAPSTTATITAGLASVPVSLEYINTKGSFEKAIVEWMQERGIVILGILSSFHNPEKNWDRKEKKKGKGKHRREMLWMVLEPNPAGAPAPVQVDAAGISTTPPPPSPGEAKVDYKKLGKKLWKGLKASKEVAVKKSNAVKIDKKKLPKGVYGKGRVYEQGNVKANRKVTAPLLKGIVEDKPVEEVKAQ